MRDISGVVELFASLGEDIKEVTAIKFDINYINAHLSLIDLSLAQAQSHLLNSNEGSLIDLFNGHRIKDGFVRDLHNIYNRLSEFLETDCIDNDFQNVHGGCDLAICLSSLDRYLPDGNNKFHCLKTKFSKNLAEARGQFLLNLLSSLASHQFGEVNISLADVAIVQQWNKHQRSQFQKEVRKAVLDVYRNCIQGLNTFDVGVLDSNITKMNDVCKAERIKTFLETDVLEVLNAFDHEMKTKLSEKVLEYLERVELCLDDDDFSQAQEIYEVVETVKKSSSLTNYVDLAASDKYKETMKTFYTIIKEWPFENWEKYNCRSPKDAFENLQACKFIEGSKREFLDKNEEVLKAAFDRIVNDQSLKSSEKLRAFKSLKKQLDYIPTNIKNNIQEKVDIEIITIEIFQTQVEENLNSFLRSLKGDTKVDIDDQLDRLEKVTAAFPELPQTYVSTIKQSIEGSLKALSIKSLKILSEVLNVYDVEESLHNLRTIYLVSSYLLQSYSIQDTTTSSSSSASASSSSAVAEFSICKLHYDNLFTKLRTIAETSISSVVNGDESEIIRKQVAVKIAIILSILFYSTEKDLFSPDEKADHLKNLLQRLQRAEKSLYRRFQEPEFRLEEFQAAAVTASIHTCRQWADVPSKFAKYATYISNYNSFKMCFDQLSEERYLKLVEGFFDHIANQIEIDGFGHHFEIRIRFLKDLCNTEISSDIHAKERIERIKKIVEKRVSKLWE
jgi:hypothetical protein